MTVESKKVVAQCSAERLYNFACDFSNFQKMLPSQVQGFKVEGDTCSFQVAGFMQLTLQYAERSPYHTVAIAPAHGSNSPLPFRLVMNIGEQDSNSCSVVLRAEVEGGNPMVTMMIKPKLRPALDKIAEQIQYYSAGL
ncbi:MAG: hypothetical protein J6Y98_01910 [Bacteroidales bacterium]|nr:hypothetical protein [Bacteroidales bacterium]MCR5192505.1 hypothetical protein [Bacteroidales bacterium]